MEPVHPKVDGYDVVRYLCKGGEGQIYVVTKSQDSDKKEFVLKTRTCVGISDANDAIQEVLAMGRVAGRYVICFLLLFLLVFVFFPFFLFFFFKKKRFDFFRTFPSTTRF